MRVHVGRPQVTVTGHVIPLAARIAIETNLLVRLLEASEAMHTEGILDDIIRETGYYWFCEPCLQDNVEYDVICPNCGEPRP